MPYQNELIFIIGYGVICIVALIVLIALAAWLPVKYLNLYKFYLKQIRVYVRITSKLWFSFYMFIVNVNNV